MTTTDLTPYPVYDLGAVGEPASPIVVTKDEAHCLTADQDLIDLTKAEVLAMMTSAREVMLQRAALVGQPTGPVQLPPPPKPGKANAVDTAGSLTVLGGALAGLIWTANTSPELAGYPILAVMA